MNILHYLKGLFQNIFDYITFFGVVDSDPVEQKDYIILTNRFLASTSFVFFFQAICNIFLYGVTREGFLLIFLSILALFMGFRLKRNYNKRIIFTLFYSLLSLLVTYYSSRLGQSSGIFLFYFPLLTTIPVLFKLKEHKYHVYFLTILFLGSLLLTVIADFQLFELDPNIKGKENSLLIINISCVLLLMIINIVALEEKRASYYFALYHNIKKENQIANYKNEIIRLKNLYDNNNITEESLSDLLNSAEHSDTIFLEKFERFFPDFLPEIKNTSDSSLNHSELKICALLKLAFTTKQIAIYTNSSIKSVEGKIYRIRKKLNIPSGVESKYWFN